MRERGKETSKARQARARYPENEIRRRARSDNDTVSFRSFLFTLHGKSFIQELEAEDIKVAIAPGLHLFPFRTEKLNLTTPMILRKWKSR